MYDNRFDSPTERERLSSKEAEKSFDRQVGVLNHELTCIGI
jgi:hypothetical protein